jgi:hypothetical protein
MSENICYIIAIHPAAAAASFDGPPFRIDKRRDDDTP